MKVSQTTNFYIKVDVPMERMGDAREKGKPLLPLEASFS